ncbi:hypothetical protein NDU88_002880 [Pleurodeles waltl]|uniref:Uncharacterized protein n=1 Tax=Pleurodeles waltl TaxID=8319 RepID=A0AAV7PBA1_PLEWA|nr:hypothetical protein NDU88_002880 [Pleurodeles waltl]
MGDVSKLPRDRLLMPADSTDLPSLSMELLSRYTLGTAWRKKNVQSKLKIGWAVLTLECVISRHQAPTSGAQWRLSERSA